MFVDVYFVVFNCCCQKVVCNISNANMGRWASKKSWEQNSNHIWHICCIQCVGKILRSNPFDAKEIRENWRNRTCFYLQINIDFHCKRGFMGVPWKTSGSGDASWDCGHWGVTGTIDVLVTHKVEGSGICRCGLEIFRKKHQVPHEVAHLVV